MTNKKPKFCIQFDDSNPTEEEKTKAICDLIFCLLKMAVKEESEKIKNRTEKKKYKENFMNFRLETLQELKKRLKEK